MKNKFLKSLSFTIIAVLWTVGGVNATSLFSNYGQIQNVQNYSTNPFWTPNSPYNQRLPQPVYVQGPDLNTEDCTRVVQSLVYVQCAARDNCRKTSLSDIRPVVMVELSNLPGNNYVSACGGYIDSIYESYVAQFKNAIPSNTVAFPDATTPNPDMNTTAPQIRNPYKQQIPKWQRDIDERTHELQELQKQNSEDFD